jgi:peptidoglycan hydrolase-like protein with peptidoglycan-binding domain
MRIKILLVGLLVVFLSGCATTRKTQDSQVQQLRNRINSLEAALQSKNEEISSLENKLQGLKSSDIRKTKDSAVLHLSLRQIQTALKSAGFYKGSIDGKTSPQTKEAIKAFQKANDLKPDGIVGKRTAEKLSRYLP